MDCPDVREQLELFALGELDTRQAAAVEAHVLDCPRCAVAVRDYRQLIGRLKARPAVGIDPRWVEQVGSAARREIVRVRRLSRWGRWLVAGGAVAAAAALVFVVWPLRPVGRWEQGAPLARRGDGRAGSGAAGSGSAVQVSLKELWRHAAARSAPVSDATAVVVRDHSAYLLLDDDAQPRVAALDAATGQVKWRSGVESVGYLSADAQRVYCLAAGGAGGTELAALDAADGRALWRYRQGSAEDLRAAAGNFGRAVVVADDRVCWTTGATVHMLDAADGQPIWTRSIAGEGLLSAAAVGPDGLYLASGSRLYCLSPATGQVLWREELAGEFSKLARPLVETADGRVFAALRQRTGNSRIICLDAASRRQVWSKSAPQVFHIQAADDRLYVRDQDVLALDAATGQETWASRANGCGPVTIANGIVYFVDTAGPGRLVSLDGRTGRGAWEMAGIRSCDAVLAASGTAYLKTADGLLRAVALLKPS